MLAVADCGPEVLACVANMTNLRHLGMSACFTPFDTWPEALTALVHLTSLELTGNVLTAEALEGVCSMTGVQHLNLTTSTGFTSLPPSISKLVNLTLESSQVESLPEAMTALTALRVLSWSQEEAVAPLQLEVLCRLKGLYTLLLTDHHLAALPEAIGHLTSLLILRVTGQALAAMPASMSALVNLMQLRLDAPELRTLPESITALTRLDEVTALGVVLQEQSPAVQAFLAGRQAKGCRLTLAPSDSE
jgi:Leucine-rich repeat (LRR) protein